MRYTDRCSDRERFGLKTITSRFYVLIFMAFIFLSGCSAGSLLGIKPETDPKTIDPSKNAFVVAKLSPKEKECYVYDASGKMWKMKKNKKNWGYNCYWGVDRGLYVVLMKADKWTKKELEEPNRDGDFLGSDANIELWMTLMHKQLYSSLAPDEHKKHHVYPVAPGKYQIRMMYWGNKAFNVWPHYIVNLEQGKVYYLGDFHYLMKEFIPAGIKRGKYYKSEPINGDEARWAIFSHGITAFAEGAVKDDSEIAWELIESIKPLSQLPRINLVKDYRFRVNIEDREFFTEKDM